MSHPKLESAPDSPVKFPNRLAKIANKNGREQLLQARANSDYSTINGGGLVQFLANRMELVIGKLLPSGKRGWPSMHDSFVIKLLCI